MCASDVRAARHESPTVLIIGAGTGGRALAHGLRRAFNVATSVPVEDWPPSNVTLVGDAIHTMTPGRGVGANTALRDAQLLCRRLIDVRDGRLRLVEAVAGYETTMRSYAWTAVDASLQNQGADNPLSKPVLGRLMLAGMRTAFRIVDRAPPLKRRIAASLLKSRGAGRVGDDDLIQDALREGP